MKYVKQFENFLNEATFRPNSGTMSGGTYTLDDNKYELKKDVKGAIIGDNTNITLPKGTVLYNLPGGLMADHESLKRYGNRNNIYFGKPSFSGIAIRQTRDILAAIEKNSKVLESVNEAKFNFSEDEVKNAAETLAKAMAKSDKVKVEVHDFEYDEGEGAGFELSYDGDEHDGGSYYIKPNGDVINAAASGAKYGTIKSSEKDYLKYFKTNEGTLNEASDRFLIKKLTDTFSKFKLSRKYEIMMDSSYGAGSKIPVLRPKGGFGDGAMIDYDGEPYPDGKIVIMSSKSGRPIPGESEFNDIDKAMVAATKYVDSIEESVTESEIMNLLSESSNPYDNILTRLGSDLKKSASTVQDYLNNGDNKKQILQGDMDGDRKDDIVIIKTSKPRANQLKPSQDTVYPDQSIGMLVTAPALRDQILSGNVSAETMFVSSDGFIIDGHHRWSATHALNPKAKLTVTQINLPIKVALPVLNAILRATNTEGQGKSGRPGKNVFAGASPDEVDEIIRDVIKNGVLGGQFMPPSEHAHPDGDPTAWYKWIAEKLPAADSWKEVPYIISANIGKMNKPAKFFGDRTQMPQIPDDPSSVKSILRNGRLDIKPPLRKNYAKKTTGKTPSPGAGSRNSG